METFSTSSLNWYRQDEIPNRDRELRQKWESRKTQQAEPIAMAPCNRKKVVKIDLEGNTLATYQSATEAAKDNESTVSSIGRACRGVYKTLGGFRYAYVKKETSNK